MFRTTLELAHVACMVRGLFTPELYIKTQGIGAMAAAGIENEIVATVVELAGVWVSAPYVATIEGARAFYRDAKKLVK